MNFNDFVAAVRSRHADEPVMTGLNDLKGTPIKTSDIIRFYTNGHEFSVRRTTGFTECNDVVDRAADGKFYSHCYDSNGGVLLFRIASSCEIVGNVHTNAEPLRRLAFFKRG